MEFIAEFLNDAQTIVATVSTAIGCVLGAIGENRRQKKKSQKSK